MFNTFMPLLIVGLIGSITSCNKLVLDGQANAFGFAGVNGYSQTSEGFVVSWSPALAGDAGMTYAVYLAEVEGNPASLAASGTTTNDLNNGKRTAKILALGEGEGPAYSSKGTLLKSHIDNSTSYTVPQSFLNSSKNYLIQVVANSPTGKSSTGGGKAVFFYTDSITYKGCLAATLNKTKTAVTVSFDNPEKSSKIQIFRGSQIIFETDSKTAGEFLDEKVTPGTTVIYTCNAVFGNDTIVGDGKLPMTIPSPQDVVGAGFLGCVSATPVGVDRISLTYEFPVTAQTMTILRDGNQKMANPVRTSSTQTFVDTGLSEGESYTYNCLATVNGTQVAGSRTVTMRTFSTNPPEFAGIRAASATNSNTIQLSWSAPTTGKVPATTYKIFMNRGATLDWNATPVKVIDSAALTTTMTGLGDEIPYIFGVRACSADGNCDANVVTKTVTIADRGAPLTVGAASAAIVSSAVQITAPWSDGNGAVKKRYIYQKSGAASSTFTDYSLVRTIVVTDILNPPTAISVSGVLERSTYSYIVRDEDPATNVNTSLAAVTIYTGKLVAPNFPGISSLSNGSGIASESTLIANYSGIATEASDPAAGASSYLIYLKVGGGDACSTGALISSVANTATAGQMLTTTISGLASRTNYSVCVKAADSAGNISNTSSYLSKYTLDVTPPSFDGIQDLSYDAANSQVLVSWNPSASNDVYQYKATIWKNSASISGATILAKAASTYGSGFTFSSTDFTYASSDVVYVLVDACDNAQSIPGGVQNCTTLSAGQAKNITMPRTTAPVGFSGISSASLPGAGQITVNWPAPASWAWYRGFKVYSVDAANGNALTLLKDCPCSANDCPNQITSCTLTGLTPYKTYILHVRAYDLVGNLTTYLDPVVSRQQTRTTDSTPPTFNSGLTATAATGGFNLAWSAASDDQSSEGSLTYKVYAKQGTTFADATNPVDGFVAGTASTTTFSHTNGVEGSTYYYTICAIDASNNSKCDGNVKSGAFPDSTPPVITNFQTDPAVPSTYSTTMPAMPTKQWKLTWNMTDSTPSANLKIYLYQKVSATPSTATVNDTLVTDAVSLDTAAPATGINSFNNIRGPANTNTYVNYLIRVVDSAGNASTATYTVYSKNAMTLTSVTPATGGTAGGTWIILEGVNIADNAIVNVGNQPCTNLYVIRSAYTDPLNIRGSRNMVTCQTPAGSLGAATVTVTNPNESGSASIVNGFTYDDTTSYCKTGSRSSATPFANSADATPGDGTAAKPFTICNSTQLGNIRSQAAGLYYELKRNIDLAAEPNFGYITTTGGSVFNGYFNGNGFMVINWTYSVTGLAANKLGFFRDVAGSGYVKNFGLANANLSVETTTTGINYFGLLAGYVSSVNAAAIDNDWVSGTISCTTGANCGGMIGTFSNGSASITNSFSTATVNCINMYGYCGGLVGQVSAIQNISNSFYAGSVTSIGTANYVGGLVGYMGGNVLGNISSVYNTGNVTGGGSVIGGLIGGSNSSSGAVNLSLSQAYVTGNVSGISSAGNGSIGGIIGSFRSNALVLNDVHYTGTVSASASTGSSTAIAGIMGSMEGSVSLTNVDSRGRVLVGAGTTWSLGGLFGWIKNSINASTPSSITNCFSTMSVTAGVAGINGYDGGGLGGLIGNAQANVDANTLDLSITSSYYSGNISGRTAAVGTSLGGLVGVFSGGAAFNGQNILKISNSYSTGSVDGDNSVGGLVGQANGTNASTGSMLLRINDSYSTMSLQSGTNNGGLIGYASNKSSGNAVFEINRSYYAATQTSVTARYGLVKIATGGTAATVTCTNAYYNATIIGGTSSSGCSTGGTNLTTTAMQAQASFSGFTFPTDWKMPTAAGYPILGWQ